MTTNTFKEQETLAPSETLLSSIPVGLVQLNTKGQVVWINEPAVALLGKWRVGALWVDVMAQAFCPLADDGHEVSLHDGRRVHVAISPLADKRGQLVTLVDMTLSRRYEKAKAQRERLVLLGRMTAQLAHQIRTPLASAVLFTDLLTQNTPEPKAQHTLARLQECHESIEQHIVDVLRFVKGEQLTRAPVNVCDFAHALKQRASALAQMHSVTLQIEDGLDEQIVCIHQESLLGAILNLIHNAIEASASEIQLTFAPIRGKAYRIDIKDNGTGLSEETKRHVFTPFYTTKAQGNGLGLAVVQGVVKAHGGDIHIRSTQGMGCCVTLTFNGGNRE